MIFPFFMKSRHIASEETLQLKEKLLDMELERLQREDEAADRRLAILLNDPEMSWKKKNADTEGKR